ncbi:MAG: thaumatin family protein [Rickettsiales bacterium]
MKKIFFTVLVFTFLFFVSGSNSERAHAAGAACRCVCPNGGAVVNGECSSREGTQDDVPVDVADVPTATTPDVPVAVADVPAETNAPPVTTTDVPAPTSVLSVVNYCAYDVWVEQQNLNGAPRVTPVIKANGGTYDYKLSPDILNIAVRFWPKSGCDANGDNCAVGQSSAPCPNGGCTPTIDSKLEVGWEATQTWFNLSMVDGYTIPIGVVATDQNGKKCIDAHPNGFSDVGAKCPTGENISLNGKYPEYANVDLTAKDPSTKKTVGCYSPCRKLMSPTSFGGLGIFNEKTDLIDAYCCSGAYAEDRNLCIGGPVKGTKFNQVVHAAYPNQQVYAWPSDDEAGMAKCDGKSKMVMTLCK